MSHQIWLLMCHHSESLDEQLILNLKAKNNKKNLSIDKDRTSGDRKDNKRKAKMNKNINNRECGHRKIDSKCQLSLILTKENKQVHGCLPIPPAFHL